MVGKGNLTVFESSNISKTRMTTPIKLVCMHNTLTSTCMNFLSRFQMIKFFDDHGIGSHAHCYCSDSDCYCSCSRAKYFLCMIAMFLIFISYCYHSVLYYKI